MGRGRGVQAALAEHRAFLFEEGSEEKTEDMEVQGERGPALRASSVKFSEEKKTRRGIDARKVWEERQRGGRLPLHVLLRLRSRYLVDGAVIGRAVYRAAAVGRKNRFKISKVNGKGIDERRRHGRHRTRGNLGVAGLKNRPEFE